MTITAAMQDFFGEALFTYTTRDALNDGVFIDTTEHLGEDLARQAGFLVPVLISNGVLADLIRVPQGAPYMSEKGRAWDILFMAAIAANARPHNSQITFKVAALNASSSKPHEDVKEHSLVLNLQELDEGVCFIIHWPHES